LELLATWMDQVPAADARPRAAGPGEPNMRQT
jgi:hypothetical protein